MKALVYTGPEQLELREAADPHPGNDNVVVKIDAVGICGSDMHAYLGHDERRPAPLILGHEAAGVIVDGPGQGKRVTINPLVTCGTCPACREGRANLCPERQIISMPPREGAFAEAIGIPETNVFELPDGLSFEKAALTEPMACSYHAIRLAAEASFRPLAEARAVVLGGERLAWVLLWRLQISGAMTSGSRKPMPAVTAFWNALVISRFSILWRETRLMLERLMWSSTPLGAMQRAQPHAHSPSRVASSLTLDWRRVMGALMPAGLPCRKSPSLAPTPSRDQTSWRR